MWAGMILAINFSGKKNLLSLFKRVRIKIHFPSVSPIIYFAKSLFSSLAVAFDSWTIENREVSSAKSFGFVIKLSDKSLMYIRKNSGLNIEPWATLASILVHEEYFPFSTTRCFLFDKKSIIKFRSFPDIPFCFNLYVRPLCHTLSDALKILIKTPLTSYPLSNDLYISWVIANNWSVHESPGLNPDWFGELRLFLWKKWNSLL